MNLFHLDKYKGKLIKDVGEAIDKDAKAMGFYVSYTFPDGIGNIDSDMKRLNVHLDKDDRVIKFTFG